jgi:hypothetical protein
MIDRLGRDMERYGPISAENPMLGQPCPACGKNFVLSEYVTLVPLGPGGNAEERRKAREGRAYSAIALQVHWSCATGEE